MTFKLTDMHQRHKFFTKEMMLLVKDQNLVTDMEPKVKLVHTSKTQVKQALSVSTKEVESASITCRDLTSKSKPSLLTNHKE